MDTKSRRYWTEQQTRKAPTLYDEWLNEEKKEGTTKTSQAKIRRHGSTAGVSVALPGTMPMRNETLPIAAAAASTIDQGRGSGVTQSDERSRYTSTSSTVLESAMSPSTRTRRKELGNNELMDTQRTPSTRARGSTPKAKGILGRRSSRSDNGSLQTASSPGPSFDEPPPAARPRTRTLDERRFFDRAVSNPSPRPRVGSVAAGTTSQVRGTDFLASVPATTTTTTTTTTTESAQPSYPKMDTSTTNTLPKRIQHLMKALNGRMSGVLTFRRLQEAWIESYCFIQEETASLIYENGDDSHRVLLPDLRGCHIEFGRSEDYIPHVVVRSSRPGQEVHLRIANQTEFDSWIAVLLTWQSKGEYRDHGSQLQPAPAVAPPPTRRSPAARSISPHSRKRADSDRSQHRRKSVVVMSLKEAPVIKIGKMIFWDTDVTYTTAPNSVVGQPGTGRPQAYRMQSYGSRRWRRISALLRENGELKLHADHDNSLLSVVQLSQLSRCAIQRLDQSVMDNEFCIAIYPQYTSNPSDSVSVLRPIFLSLDSRVLHEVWFVLLRAFTIPQLYGPRLPDDFGEQDPDRDLEKMLAEQTTDMFRMERSLSVRVVEAKLYSNIPSEHARNQRPEQYGYHVELLLDNETRAKTAVKFEGLNPLWGETFDFADLPPVLTSASVLVKRRPPDTLKMAQDGLSDAQGGFSGINSDLPCGKVEIYLDELAATNEAERWWPIVNMFNQRVGEVLVKARADEGVVLMARDYQPLSDLLHKFTNGLSLQLAQIVPSELKRLSDCLLNIYQVSGRAGDWIMALVEDEIDSIHKETPITRLRYNGRSNDDHLGSGAGNTDRELMVRDMNKNATLEANLLFRGNTLLTKSLDSHMRRVGKDFLEAALATKLREICERDPDCEVDPNRASEAEVNRNWRRLIALTSEVWKSIIAAKHTCPVELRRIFRHIRACAEDRYGDFLRSVSYSSVSGFLFLRFFCPAVLNPKLFGLFKGMWRRRSTFQVLTFADEIKPKGRRTLTLIAKSLQTLANMASFGTKEQWMEPMNIFLGQSREAFKSFIDDICYVPVPASARSEIKIVSSDTHLSYTTPMTIMQRLPPTSREGFPSLPYLIDQPRAYAELVQLWLETTSDASATRDMAFPGKSKADLLSAIRQSDGDVREFHEVCFKLNARTQECLSRAERAERPHSALSFQWEELIDQLQSPTEDTDEAVQPDDHIAHSTVRSGQVEQLVGSLRLDGAGDAPIRPPRPDAQRNRGIGNAEYRNGRLPSRSSEPPASPTSFDAGHSSTVSSDDASTTALPSYQREIVQRCRGEDESGRSSREPGEKRQGIKFVSALRKKRNDLQSNGNSIAKTP